MTTGSSPRILPLAHRPASFCQEFCGGLTYALEDLIDWSEQHEQDVRRSRNGGAIAISGSKSLSETVQAKTAGRQNGNAFGRKQSIPDKNICCLGTRYSANRSLFFGRRDEWH